jgi:uncharacterized membrane protein YkoI
MKKINIPLICLILFLYIFSACSDTKQINSTDITDSGAYISLEEAIEVAKESDNNPELKWSAKLIENKEQEIDNKKATLTVWEVTALYPAGNKMVVTLDAGTGKQISLTEIEVSN